MTIDWNRYWQAYHLAEAALDADHLDGAWSVLCALPVEEAWEIVTLMVEMRLPWVGLWNRKRTMSDVKRWLPALTRTHCRAARHEYETMNRAGIAGGYLV